jgi:FAD/FMN-containing dehydrogenase
VTLAETDVQTGESKVKRLFGEAYPRLQKIKAKYDPNMVFNKWFPIVPDEHVRVHE